MSARREELHHLVDELPEAEVRAVLELIRGRADAAHRVRDLPFFASFEPDPELAERAGAAQRYARAGGAGGTFS